jgi:hypothetical protein
MMAVPVERQPRFKPGTPQSLFTGDQVGVVLHDASAGFHSIYDVTPNGQRFVVVRPVGEPAVKVVQNWIKEFERQDRAAEPSIKSDRTRRRIEFGRPPVKVDTLT